MSIKFHPFGRRFSLRMTRLWKRTLPQGLFGRSMLILVTPLILTLAIGVFVFFDRHWSTTTNNLSNSLSGEVVLITEAWEHETTSEGQKDLQDLVSRTMGLDIKFNPKANFHRRSSIALPRVKSILKNALQDRLHRPFFITGDSNSDQIIISVRVQNGVLDFYVPEKRLFSTTTYVFLLIMLGSGLFLSLVAVIFMRNQIRPIRKLAVAAEKFGKGIDVHQFRPAGAREIRQAAQAFLEMRDRIKRQIRQRTDMLAGVSHDLRTPLTRMKLQVAMLPDNSDKEAMQGDIKVMEKMIKAYLDFARGESLENPLRCDLNDLLNQAIADAERQGLHIHASLPDTPVNVLIRPQAIQRVFANILDNARLYAHEAWLMVNLLPRTVEIILDDNGPGIPMARQEEVFRPFYRLDESRNQNIEGTGLGLTIARDLVQSHGGTIQLDTAPQGGLRVIIRLPL